MQTWQERHGSCFVHNQRNQKLFLKPKMDSETDFESDLTDVETFEKNLRASLRLDSLKRHKCPYEGCHSAFNRPWKLDRHINSHTKNRPFKCDVEGCTKDYTNNSHLQRHKSLTHAKSRPLPVYLECPYQDCDKTFSNKWNLKKHCNLHKNSALYKCKICSTEFRKHVHLKTHMSTSHLGLKPFTCSTCDESFESKKDLKKHEKKHKTYDCKEEGCNEKFDKFHALRTHLRNAHPKWLECDFCGKQYLNKYSLTEHILGHMPMESREVITCPYKDCERYYFHQRNLGHHIKSYHQDINHKCEICQQTLVNRSKLREHMKLHGRNKEPKLSKPKKPRKPRRDKGLPRKSMASTLSGIRLPGSVDKNLARNEMTPEDIDCIETVKEKLIEGGEESVSTENITRLS